MGRHRGEAAGAGRRASSKPPRPDRRCARTACGSSTRVMESNTQLIANEQALADSWKRTKIENIALLLRAAIEAQGRVGLMLNVQRDDLDKVLALLPALQRPTISSLSEERMGRREHDHRRAHRARPDSEAESGRRSGHRRVPAEQDRCVTDDAGSFEARIHTAGGEGPALAGARSRRRDRAARRADRRRRPDATARPPCCATRATFDRP